MKIVTTKEMRLIEERCMVIGITMDDLMDNAGLRVAQKAWQLFGDLRHVSVLTLVGSGNNGSDGLVAARILSDWGADVTVYVALPRKDKDPRLKLLEDRHISCILAEDDKELSLLEAHLAKSSLAIDAILGTGITRPVDGKLAAMLSALARARATRSDMYLMALDLPTGLNPDTGESDPLCPYVDITVTLGFPKIGMFTFPGATRVGRLEIVDIGIPASLVEDCQLELITPDRVRNALPPRPMDSHKGTFGRVLVVAGSFNYIGAAYLASEAAARVGVGLVTLAIPRSLQPTLATKLTEVTYLPLPEEEGKLSPEASDIILSELPGYQAILLGCGLGQGADVSNLIRQVLLTTRYPGVPMVLDADALNIMSRIPEWWLGLSGDGAVTPHLGEISRLTGKTSGEINADRVNNAKQWASLWGKTLVLKGAYTVISSPSGQACISPFANPSLSSAGTGDVLAGALVGLLGQGMSPFDAACCAVYLHGVAGEQARLAMGDTGVVASDLLTRLPLAIKELKERDAYIHSISSG